MEMLIVYQQFVYVYIIFGL